MTVTATLTEQLFQAHAFNVKNGVNRAGEGRGGYWVNQSWLRNGAAKWPEPKLFEKQFLPIIHTSQ